MINQKAIECLQCPVSGALGEELGNVKAENERLRGEVETEHDLAEAQAESAQKGWAEVERLRAEVARLNMEMESYRKLMAQCTPADAKAMADVIETLYKAKHSPAAVTEKFDPGLNAAKNMGFIK